jgi:hypothetical protein
VGTLLDDGALERRRRGGAAIAVDVLAVGLAADRRDGGAELGDHLGATRYAAPLAPSTTTRQPVERELAREGVLHEDVVAAERVVDAVGLADVLGGRTEVVDAVVEHEALDLELDLVGQLEALAREELDAVVLEGIVRAEITAPGVGARLRVRKAMPGVGIGTDRAARRRPSSRCPTPSRSPACSPRRGCPCR